MTTSKHANKRELKGVAISYPAGRKSKNNPNGLPPAYLKHEIVKRMKECVGMPNKTREQRSIVKEFNPFHFIFGEVRPVWKTWKNYAENMELLHGGLYEDEDYQDIPQAEQA